MEDRVLLAHGGGGKMMHELIDKVFRQKFDNKFLNGLDDSAVLPSESGSSVVFTTDSYVVKPLFFPGGDIGKLSVCGTVNDLSVSGARPAFISAGVIAEEGLEIRLLEEIAASMAKECGYAGVQAVCGDFKVVEKGSADGVYINTAGIGFLPPEIRLSTKKIRPGDKVLINGPVGDHEAAIMLERGDFRIEGEIKSDCCSLAPLISSVVDFHAKVLGNKGEEVLRFMRDATRGGAAAVLNEIAGGADFGVRVFEGGLPVREEVGALCELLGLDPAYLANEGKAVLVVNGKYSGEVLEIMRKHALGGASALAGEIVGEPPGKVVARTSAGGERIMGMPPGGQLPRIC